MTTFNCTFQKINDLAYFCTNVSNAKLLNTHYLSTSGYCIDIEVKHISIINNIIHEFPFGTFSANKKNILR